MELLVKSKLIGIVAIIFLISGCSTNSDGSEPQPTKTVYVPVPESGINSGFQDEFNSNLDDIRESNCRLADDLMFQSLDLSRQARDLESQAFSMPSGSDLSYQLQDQARKIKQQSFNLLIQSDQLRQNC
jgi:hypothetical protein